MNSSRMNLSSLVFGAIFVALGIMFLLHELDVWELDVSYVIPILLIGLGIGVAVGAMRPRAGS